MEAGVSDHVWSLEEIARFNGGAATMTLERGFHRLTTAVSIGLLLVGLGLSAFLFPGAPMPLSEKVVLGAVFVLLPSAAPWVVFYVARWIARGFRIGPN